MKYCQRCVQPNTRPGVVFDESGICMACRWEEEKEQIDWGERESQLGEIAKWAKANSNGFDCIVGVSGGKDSHFQAFYARDELGLKCLLVNCAPDNITEVGRQNLENLVQRGFDMVSFRPNPKVMRRVTKKAFYEYGNPVKPSEYPLYAVTYQAAIAFKIPLIIQGENPAITLGIGDMEKNGNAWSIRHHNTLAGCNTDNWVGDGIEERDLLFYQFPEVHSIVAVYLNYYVEEWGFNHNTAFAVMRGLRGRPEHDPALMGRISSYSSTDSDMQIVNQMLKYYKFGFGFVTDEVCYLIREGQLSRKYAIPLVKKFDGKCDRRYVLEFCDYIGITEKRFWCVVDEWVNRDLFEKREGEWIPKFEVGEDFYG